MSGVLNFEPVFRVAKSREKKVWLAMDPLKAPQFSIASGKGGVYYFTDSRNIKTASCPFVTAHNSGVRS